MTDMDSLHRHPVRVVSQRTGLSPHVLRAWERRYKAVSPGRSDAGRRLYSDREIERLSLLRRATVAGHSISLVARLDDAALRRMVEEIEAALPLAGLESGKMVSAGETVRACLHSAEALDGVALEKALRRSAVVLGVRDLVVDVLVPLMHEIGRRWHSGRISPAHEHLASGVVGRTLSWIMDSTTNNGTAPVMVVGTPSGESHELGAMLAAATAAAEGWRIVYLGSDLPAEDIVNAAKQVGARCVALSIIFPESEPVAMAQVARMRKLLPEGTSLIVGGPDAGGKDQIAAAGVHFVHEIAALPRLLDSLAPD